MRPAGRAIPVVLALLWSMALQATPARAQGDLEYSVKANYLVRFTAFVTWPPSAFASPQAPVVICVAGRDPFGRSLEAAARSQTAHGRRVAIRRLGDPSAVAGCHIVYVGRDGGAALGGAVGRPAMVVTDQSVGPERGAVHFVVAEGRVRFHIDQQQAARGGLGVSSRLLNLALSVRGG